MRRRAGILLLGALLAGGCDSYQRTLDGPYKLSAIDTMESMSIVWDAGDGTLVGDGLPGPTVFAAGYDAKYLVAAIHPQLCKPFQQNCAAQGPDRSKTEYWYVVRTTDERDHLPYAGIKGPFDAAAFAEAKKRLGLPDLSIRYPELE
jgi:hypothetical protein